MLNLGPRYLATETGIRYLRPKSLVDYLSYVIEGYLHPDKPNHIETYSYYPGTEVVAFAVVGDQSRLWRPTNRIWFLRHEVADWVDGAQTLTPAISSGWHPQRIQGDTSFLATDSAVDPLGIAAGQPPSEPRAIAIAPEIVEAERRRSSLHRRNWSYWRAFYGIPEPTELKPYFFGAYVRG